MKVEIPSVTGKPVAVAGREGENSERVTGKPFSGCRRARRWKFRKPVAVADGRESGPTSLDLTKWDFNNADCRNKCRKLVENSKPLLLNGSPIDSGRESKERARAVLHLAFICELYEIQLQGGRYFLHAHSQSADSSEQPTVLDCMNRFLDTFQTVADRSLFGPNVSHGMSTLTRWLTNSGSVAQALSSLNHSSTGRQTTMSAMSQQLHSDLGIAGSSDPLQHRPPSPKLDILAFDADEEPPEEWEAEDDVKGVAAGSTRSQTCP